MSNYVIGIGGTGAKCVEALVHLTAAGMMPEGELFTLFVDPDTANGNLGSTQITLKQYQACESLELGDVDLLKTSLSTATPEIWTPFGEEIKPTLADYFQYNNLGAEDPDAAALFDVLYSEKEKKETLDVGFRGHPSIGAAVMAKAITMDRGEPWSTFRQRLEKDIKEGEDAKIYLFGSIFGGTGASGFPTIAQLIRDEFRGIGQQNAQLGGALMLPYFSFSSDIEKTELRASSENFLLSTQAALVYYKKLIDDKQIFDSVTLLGDERQSSVRNPGVLGGGGQKNEPHFLEIYAALAAIDFFSPGASKGCPVMVARQESELLKWSDLPDNDGGTTIKRQLGHLARFAFAYLSVYLPMIEDIRRNGASNRAPWYVDLFERQSLNPMNIEKDLEGLKSCCRSFLLWLANIQTSANKPRIDLVKWDTFAEEVQNEVRLRSSFRINEFESLVLPDDTLTLGRVWKKISNFPAKEQKRAIGVGRFFHALYRACELP